MNDISVPHDPTPLVALEVFLPYGTAISETSIATWRDAAWTTFVEIAHPKVRAAVEKLLTIVSYSDLIVIKDVSDRTDMPGPAQAASALSLRGGSYVARTEGAPRFVVATRNGDEYDPLPFVLAWTTAVGIARHEHGVVFAPRLARLWDPAVELMPKLGAALAVRDFLEFDAAADERGSYVSTLGLPYFGLPELAWHAPAGTDAQLMKNLLVCATSAILRLRRSAARQIAPGQTTLDLPAKLPVLFGDLASAYGLDAQQMTPPPETELAMVPLDLSTATDFVIRTNASASALNEWLAHVREQASRLMPG